MTRQKNALQAVLDRRAKDAARETDRAQANAPLPVGEMSGLQPAEDSIRASRSRRSSREGRKLISGHFDPKVSKQLKLLAVEEDTTVQALLEEALDLLFMKKGKDVIPRA